MRLSTMSTSSSRLMMSEQFVFDIPVFSDISFRVFAPFAMVLMIRSWTDQLENSLARKLSDSRRRGAIVPKYWSFILLSRDVPLSRR